MSKQSRLYKNHFHKQNFGRFHYSFGSSAPTKTWHTYFTTHQSFALFRIPKWKYERSTRKTTNIQCHPNVNSAGECVYSVQRLSCRKLKVIKTIHFTIKFLYVSFCFVCRLFSLCQCLGYTWEQQWRQNKSEKGTQEEEERDGGNINVLTPTSNDWKRHRQIELHCTVALLPHALRTVYMMFGGKSRSMIQCHMDKVKMETETNEEE